MAWLDRFFAPGITYLLINGVQQPVEKAVNLIAGSNVTIAAVDNPTANPPRTDVTVSSTGGGGGGGTIVTASASGSITANSSPQLFLITAGGGTFNLPTSGLTLGMMVGFKDDFATSATTGIAATPVTINGGTKSVQNRHNMTIAATSYTFGGTSGDGGGSLVWFTYDGTQWVVTG